MSFIQQTTHLNRQTTQAANKLIRMKKRMKYARSYFIWIIWYQITRERIETKLGDDSTFEWKSDRNERWNVDVLQIEKLLSKHVTELLFWLEKKTEAVLNRVIWWDLFEETSILIWTKVTPRCFWFKQQAFH